MKALGNEGFFVRIEPLHHASHGMVEGIGG